MLKMTILLFIALAAAPVTQAEADRYRVTIERESPRRAIVEARLVPKNGIISLSRSGRDTGLYHGWATFVHEIEASTDEGSPVVLEYIPTGQWELVDHDGSPINVRYTMLLQHDRFPNDPGEDELAWARSWGVMWTGRALFLEGAVSEGIAVEFEIPDGWNVSAPWSKSEASAHSFNASNTDALLDSAFVVGEHEEILLGDPRQPAAVIALGGEAPLEAKPLIVGLVGQTLETFSQLFGSPPEKRLMLIAADGSYWGGGVMGSSISMLFGGSLDETTVPMVVYITTHEMFHLWNANFHYSGVEAADDLQWFSEGSAEYYTWLTAVRNGLVNVETFLGEWGQRYQKYRAARTDRSLSETGKVKLDHYDLIYSGGMMAVAGLDLRIRSATGGEKSMNNVLRAIQARFPSSGTDEFDLDGLPGVVRSATGVEVGDFFDDYVRGNEEIPMERYFALAGLALATSSDDDEGGIRLSIVDSPSEKQAAVWRSLMGDGS